MKLKDLYNKFYQIEQVEREGKTENVVVGIKDKEAYREYIAQNQGDAPPIPKGVQRLDENLFEGFEEISSIHIPSSVSSLTGKTFEKLNNLKSINYGNYYEMSLYNVSPEGVFEPSLRIIDIYDKKHFNDYLKKHIGMAPPMPEGVRYLWHSVFKNNEYLRQIKMPKSLTQIYWYAFQDCKNLERVKTSSKLHYLGGEVFSGCEKLKEFTLPKTIKQIKCRPFKDCNPNMKIDVFGVEKIKQQDFELEIGDDYSHWPTAYTERFLMETPREQKYTTLQTGNAFYILEDGKVTKLDYSEILSIPNGEDIILNGNGDKFLNFKRVLEKTTKEGERIYYPPAHVINNLPSDQIENYTKYSKTYNNIIKQARSTSLTERERADGTMEKFMSVGEQEALFKLAVISGVFEENESIRSLAHNFLTRILLANPKQPNKGLNLNIQEVEKYFLNITEKPAYNEEFSAYFLHKGGNMQTLFNTILEKQKDGKGDFLQKVYSKFGESKLQYERSGKMEKSKGLMHDRWEVYRRNSGKGENNYNFIDYVCNLGDVSINLDNVPEELKEYVEELGKYCHSLDAIKRTVSIIKEGEKVLPYTVLSLKDTRVMLKSKLGNVAREGVAPVNRDMMQMLPNPEYLDEINTLMQETSKKLEVKYNEHISGKAAAKGKEGLEIAKAAMMMGTCAQVTSSGCEEFIEGQIAENIQPFFIKSKDEQGNDLVIATCRLEVNRGYGYAIVPSFEVARSVRDQSSEKEQEGVYFTLVRILDKYCTIYNQQNKEKPIKYISLGKMATCTINSIIEQYAPTLKYPLPNVEEKLTYIPTAKSSQFLIWQIDQDIENLQKFDEPIEIDNLDMIKEINHPETSLEM